MGGAGWTLLLLWTAIGQAEPVPDWLQRLSDPDPEVRFLAAHHVEGRDAVPALTALLDDAEPAIRDAAMCALGRIGAPASTAAPRIAELILKSPNAGRRGVWALERIGPGALSAWVRLAKDGHASLRVEAVTALGGTLPVDMDVARFLAGRIGQGDAAAKALVHMGEPALPLLEEALLGGDARATGEVAEALALAGELGQPSLIKGLASDRVDVRRTCILALYRPSEDHGLGRVLLDAVARRCRDDDTEARHRASELLCMHAAQAPDLVVVALQDADARVREETTSRLRADSVVPEPVLAALKTLLDDSDIEVRKSALLALERLRSGDATLLPILIRALEDRDAITRECAARMLGALGDAAAPAAEALGGLLSDEAPSVRVRAAESLRKLGASALPALPALCAALRKGDDGGGVSRAILSIGGPAVDPLIGILADADPAVRIRAAGCLGALGPVASAAVPPLVEALGSPEAELRACVALALGGIRADAPRVIPLLIKALSDRRLDVQLAAREGLVRYGAEAASAVASILDEAGSDAGLRDDALRILAGIGPGATEALASRTALLADPDPKRAEVARAAFVALGEGGVPILERALVDPDPLVRRQALWGLRELIPKVDGAFAPLPGMLQDADPSVRLWATRAIGQLADKEVSALPALAAVVKDGNVEVRRELAAQVEAASRRMSAWRRKLEPYLLGKDAAERAKADEADGRRRAVVGRLLPLIAAGLADPNPAVQEFAVRAAAQLDRESLPLMPDVVRLLSSPDLSVRRIGSGAIENMVYLLPAAMGDYLARVRSGAPEREAAAAVGLPKEVDPSVIHALVEALRDEDIGVRANVAEALGALGDAEEALPALQERMWKDPEEDVQWNAAEAILRIAVRTRRPGAMVDVLRKEALQPPKGFWHSPPTASSLSALGEEAGPDLIAALRDPDPRVRRRCLSVFRPFSGLQELPGSVQAPVLALLSDADDAVREEARGVVQWCGLDPGMDVLLGWVADPGVDLRRNALRLLVRHHPGEPGTAVAIAQALDTPDTSVRSAAMECVGTLGPAGERFVPSLIQALGDPDDDIRRAAVYSLGSLGPTARPAAGRLAMCVAEWGRYELQGALGALGAIGPDAAPWAPTLAARLDVEDNSDHEMEIALALGRIGPKAASTATRLRALLAHGDEGVRLWTAMALIRMGCAGPEVLEKLVPLLASDNYSCRDVACDALAEWGEGAREALPALRKALEDPEPSVREAAAKAISAIEEDR